MIKAKVIVMDQAVRAKLLAAEPRILAHNRLMVTEILNVIKPTVAAATPVGPGHFGYHGRDTITFHVVSKGIATTGKLVAAVQLYWREFGTHGGFHKKGTRAGYAFAFERLNKLAHLGGGERAFMTAHKALAQTRAIIRTFYGGQAAWWRL